MKECNLDNLYGFVQEELDALTRYMYIGGKCNDFIDVYCLIFDTHIKKNLVLHIYNFVKENFHKYFDTLESYDQEVFCEETPTVRIASRSRSVSILYNVMSTYMIEKSHFYQDLVEFTNLVLEKEPDFADGCLMAILGGIAEARRPNAKNETMYETGCGGKNAKIIKKIADKIKKRACVDYPSVTTMYDKEEFAKVGKEIGDGIIEETVRYAFSTYVPNPTGRGRSILLAESLMKNAVYSHRTKKYVYDKFLVLEDYLNSMTSHYLVTKWGVEKYISEVRANHYHYDQKSHPYWYWVLETAHGIMELNTDGIMGEFKKNARAMINKQNKTV